MPAGVLSLTLLAAALAPVPAPADEPAAACAPDQVAVVVDFNELGGPTRVGCATAEDSAAHLFGDAGFPLTFTTAPGMQGFVCTVAGAPTDRSCTRGDSYWSLWWSDGEQPWSYATLGVDQLDVPPGGYVGFAWHEGAGDATAPDVAVGQHVDAATAPTAPTASSATSERAADGAATPEQRGALPWLAGGLVVVVLGAAAVPILRRRR